MVHPKDLANNDLKNLCVSSIMVELVELTIILICRGTSGGGDAPPPPPPPKGKGGKEVKIPEPEELPKTPSQIAQE